MKLVIAFLAVSCAVGLADRSLHQMGIPSPGPAPGPAADCPAPTSPGSNCVAQASQFQTSCATFNQALISATGGAVTARTDTEMQALVHQLQDANQMPSTACCTAITALLENACACDSSVQAIALAQQNLTPEDFQSVGSLFLLACGKPSCYDTCRLTA